MEAIKNYLDNMFANLPGTPGVLRAKEELGQMMEDKYTELINEGKSENEAVGSVISEFGNLNELAEALGLEKEMEEQKVEAEAEPELRILTVEEAKEYIKMRFGKTSRVSLGIALCILSVVCPIIVSSALDDRFDFLGAIGLFAVVMVGVGFIIYGSVKDRKWSFIKEKKATLSMEATKYVTEERDRYDRTYVTQLIIGIMLCAMAWVPAAVLDEFTSYADGLGGAMFFIMSAFGVFLLRNCNVNKSTYKKLLALNKKGTMKANYKKDEPETMGEVIGEQVEKTVEKHEKAKYISPVAQTFMELYWPTVTCLYLCASFITFKFGLTWIIWPIAGVLHGVFSRNLTE